MPVFENKKQEIPVSHLIAQFESVNVKTLETTFYIPQEDTYCIRTESPEVKWYALNRETQERTLLPDNIILNIILPGEEVRFARGGNAFGTDSFYFLKDEIEEHEAYVEVFLDLIPEDAFIKDVLSYKKDCLESGMSDAEWVQDFEIYDPPVFLEDNLCPFFMGVKYPVRLERLIHRTCGRMYLTADIVAQDSNEFGTPVYQKVRNIGYLAYGDAHHPGGRK